MAFAWYRAQVRMRPMMTQAMTTGALFGAGDVIAQTIAKGKAPQELDYMRTIRNAGYGLCAFGPAVQVWYRMIEKIRFQAYPKLDLPAKILADQVIFTPVHLACFFGYHAYLEGKSIGDALKQKFWPAIRANWMLWPAVQMVNFTLVPAELRVLFVNVVALAWNAYLSTKAADSSENHLQYPRRR
ncbi:protein SYM1 [Ascobolus immersus RN42]|uniref:Protein SYM1 n=1 Tax=Ascobolus immersus RN42 TaxID=1160509 RepID=A0A3N4ICU5_ASCIM|nr:protein SYM1 [Ascobolus immersus RN42]